MLKINEFLIKEDVEFLKLTSTYHIFDPNSNYEIGYAKDEPTTFFKYLRLLVNKKLLPTQINIYDNHNQLIFSINKSASFIRSKVSIYKNGGEYLGNLVSKIFTIGGGFHVYDKNENQVAEIKGDWVGWNFRFINEAGDEIGFVTKKWAGIGKELFTSADNYMISFNQGLKVDENTKILLIAAGLAIDTVYKEKN